MKVLTWLLVFVAIGVLGYAMWSWRQRWLERQRAAEKRLAAFIAEARPAAAAVSPAAATPAAAAAPMPAADKSLVQEKLLYEAAAKAGEAGEPVLSIQLYARLLARYPQTGFAEQARAAVETQKQKLAKA
jgi:hypothetical protein